MLDLRQLQTFYVVAITNNFSRAAKQLGCTQSSVTTRVQSLERELGVQLFDRQRGKSITLTSVGRRTFEHAGRLLALAAEIRMAVHSQ
jgi:DNA-binding transcriptional LysR family regulator